MATNDDDANKLSEGCFDLFAALLLACGDDETRAKQGQEVQERNMIMIETITSAATNTFLLGKRKIEDDDQENTASSSSSSSSRSLVESKRRRVESSEEPIRAEPIREIKPPVKKRKRPVKRKAPVRKEPVRREPPVVTPGWVIDLMKTSKGREGDAKMIFEKAMTKTDLTSNQGRLLMPFNQMADMHFLTEAEWKILEEHHKHKGDVKKGVNVDEKMKGVDVILLRRNGNNKGWELNLRIWEMSSSFNYALCTGWNQVVRDNDLHTNQTITLWSFHSRDGTLYFAFDLPTQDEEGMALALVPVTSSSMDMVEISEEDPFACEEANRRLYQFIRSSRTPRVCVQIITNDSSGNLNLLEGGLDLNRTPPEECTEMDSDLEAVQETHHIRSTSLASLTETSQEFLTEPSLVSWRENSCALCDLNL
ncbi:hypothetical protein DY000_02034959 [Brassica cretica]|uniref:TF-B3 domain-containing protein n=1 Tax=Brassica cretica TaxID=69181 RepID=A0ABQ7DS40_BRACR|nr:hypothetical protein DY000_02034959 [Brassica cretica]